MKRLLNFALIIGNGASPILGCHPAAAGSCSIRALCWITNQMLSAFTSPAGQYDETMQYGKIILTTAFHFIAIATCATKKLK